MLRVQFGVQYNGVPMAEGIGPVEFARKAEALAFSVSFTERAQGEFRAIHRSANPATRRDLNAALDRLQENPFPSKTRRAARMWSDGCDT